MALEEFEVGKSKIFKKGDKVLLLEDIETMPDISNPRFDHPYPTEFKDLQQIEVGTVLRRRPCIFNAMTSETSLEDVKARRPLKYGWEYKVYFPKTKKKVYIHENNLQSLEVR